MTTRTLPTLLLTFLLISSLVGCGAFSSSTNGSSSATGSGNTSGGNGSGTATPVGFLYAIENPNAASVVQGFSISNTGALTALTPTVSAGDNANDIVTDSTSKFVFVGNSYGCCTGQVKRPNQLLSYTIGSTGALTASSETDLPNQNDTINGLLLDPAGSDLYVSSMQVIIKGTISSFSVNNTSGGLTSLGPDPLNSIMPGRMAMHPNGKYVYATVQKRHGYPEMGGFGLFLRDPATGILTDSQKVFPGSLVGSDFYTDVAISAGGQYLLAIVPGKKITVYSIDQSTGDLKIASETTGNFNGLTVDNTGKFAIVSLNDGTVNSYMVNADGSLTKASSATAAAGISSVITDSTNKFVYAESSSTSQIYGFTFNASNGALAAVPGSPFATSAVPIRMAAAK